MADTGDALRACEERFRNLIARNADAIVVVDRRGIVRFVNPAAEVLFRRLTAHLVGSEFGFPVVAGEITEVDVLSPDGAMTAAEMRVVETEWAGQPAFLAVLRDCTERKRAEEERVQLLREQVARAEAEQAIRERDAFLAVASHELKTPLSNISATVQLLTRRLGRRGALEPDQLRSGLVRLDEQARRLAGLVSRLVDVADISAGTLVLTRRRVDLGRLVVNLVAAQQATTSTHTIAVRAAAGLEAAVDPARVEQLLVDLLDNAIRYSPAGGPIEVDLVARDDQTARLVVRDHGPGIPAERRSRVFQRLSRAHADDYVSGLGLGLFVSRHIAELHGGRLEAEFPDDGGTCFVVTLPIGDGDSDRERGPTS